MPHSRSRFIQQKLLQKLHFSPVTAIQGSRQTGKSYFARELLPHLKKNTQYLSFDRENTLLEAKRDIETFLELHSDAQPLVIDEAQKVPQLFDAVKYKVDQKRIPGTFVLLGSTEFSKLSLIRESLTGRISKVRFYPFTIAEAHQLPHRPSKEPFYLSSHNKIDRKKFTKHLEQGGFPGIFSIRNSTEREEALLDWISLTCERDIHQFPKIKLDSDLCRLLLRLITTLDEPTAANLAKESRTNAVRVNRHLEALAELFVVQPIRANTLGTGKTIYYLPDVALVRFLGASLQRQLETLFLQEWLAKHSFNMDPKDQRTITYFRTNRGSRLSFIEETNDSIHGIAIFDSVHIDTRNFYAMLAFERAAKKAKYKKIVLCSYGPMELHSQKKVRHYSWERVG